MTKTCIQTIHVCPPGSSTPEFQTIERVPVYELAPFMYTHLYYSQNTITTVNEHGDVTFLNVKTGERKSWYSRPSLQMVVTMNMVSKIGGYYYEFSADGSISSSDGTSTYYWGPVEETDMVGEQTIGFTTVRDYMIANEHLWESSVRKLHTELLETNEIREPDDDHDTDDCCCCRGQHRDDRSDDTLEVLAAIQRWQDALKARLENNPGVRDHPENRTMHEQCIETATKEIDRLKLN